MNPTFARIFEIAKSVNVECCIAGGAVVDFGKANDIDVFVLDGPSFALATALDAAHTVVANAAYEASDFQVIASCQPSWSEKPIQITRRRDCTSVQELLESFDLSVHQWGIANDGILDGLCFVKTSTGVREPIRVIRVTPTTAIRLVKLTQRYFPIAA